MREVETRLRAEVTQERLTSIDRELIRDAGIGVERYPDGSWAIAADHLDRAVAYEAGRAQEAPIPLQFFRPNRWTVSSSPTLPHGWIIGWLTAILSRFARLASVAHWRIRKHDVANRSSDRA